MAAFTLKLGSVDLSAYLRVNSDDGFDPYDQDGFLDPQFGESPFAEGQPVVGVDVQNRMLAWPLHLNAASKDLAHALVRSINNEIASNPQLRVEWKDAGATNSTFYDVAFARFDPEFKYRRAVNNWESGTLRIWTAPPYGHTATTRLAAAPMATTGIARVLPINAASPIIGDAPPLLDVIVKGGASRVLPQNGGRVSGYAPLPHPSYAGLIPAASMVPVDTATYNSQASGAQASGQLIPGVFPIITAILPEGRFSVALSPASVYAGGRHRVLGIARSYSQGMGIRLNDPFGQPMGPTAVATTMDWSISDLGMFSVPTDIKVGTLVISGKFGLIKSEQAATGLAMNGINPFSLNGLPSVFPGISGLIVAPDDQLRMVVDSPRRLIAAVPGPVPGIASGGIASGLYDGLGNAIVVPTYVAATGFTSQGDGKMHGGPSGVGALIAHSPVADIHIGALMQYGPVGAVAIIRKQFDIASYSYVAGCAKPDSLSLLSWNGAATTVLASVANTVLASTIWFRLDFGNQGQQAYISAQTMYGGTVALGSLGVNVPGATIAVDQPGRTALIAGLAGVDVLGAWVESVPSSPMNTATRVAYEFMDTFSIQRQDNAGSAIGDVTGFGRGAGLPPVTPSSAVAILAFAASLEGGSGVDLLDVSVSVRERFQLAR